MRRVALLAALVLALTLGWWLARPEGSAPEAPAEAAPEAAAPPSAPPFDAPVRPTRAPIPRPVRKHRGAEKVVQVEPAGPAKAEDTAAPKGGVDPNIPLTAEGLTTVVDRMRPSIATCIEAWTVEEPSIRGHVLLAFQIGPEGVQDAWVAEHTSVPTAVLGCFSAAVYEQDWPAAPDGVEVTLPFDVEAGLEDAAPGSTLRDRRGETPG